VVQLAAVFLPLLLPTAPYSMPYAIIRIAKLTSQAHAHNATTHNYRQHEVSNADPAAQHPNLEFINHPRTDYWTLAEARIAEEVTRKVRPDQVRAVEVIMTGSPEAFIRDKDGRAADYSNSKWLEDNLNFLKERYGEKNLVSFTIHQDEKTPHVHAVVIPITADGRLSAKDIFNREGLRQLQTDYAQAMQPHGMSRGIEHSQAEHQPMRRQYAQEAKTAQQVAELAKPTPAAEPFKLGKVPLTGRDEWKTTQEARIQGEIARQVGQERERAGKLAELAQVNTAAAERVKTLQKQLSTSEGLKQGHFGTLQTAREQELVLYHDYNRTAVQYAQGASLPDLAQYGREVIADEKTALTGHLAEILKGKVASGEAFIEQLGKQGYQVERGAPGQTAIVHEQTGARFLTTELRPNEQALAPQLNAAIERTAQQAKSQSKGQSQGGGIGMGGR
jgi:hypothetical protein